uniref:Pecanex-like protein n=1 Tax=Schistosoma curassoni TaxID=6186 RepID=A0A183KUB6_9TREM
LDCKQQQKNTSSFTKLANGPRKPKIERIQPTNRTTVRFSNSDSDKNLIGSTVSQHNPKNGTGCCTSSEMLGCTNSYLQSISANRSASKSSENIAPVPLNSGESGGVQNAGSDIQLRRLSIGVTRP